MDRRAFITASGFGLAGLLGSGVGAVGADDGNEAYTEERHRVESFDGTEIPTTLFVPEGGADAAILATHGWGGSRSSAERFAPLVAGHGYALVAFDQRGFGDSTGEVGLSGPNEVNDVSALIDFVSDDDRIENGPDGEPRIGMLGESYAGGIQLNAAAVDERIDVLAPIVPWHDLTFSLAPNGVPKLGWTTLLYASGIAAARGLDDPAFENLQEGVSPRLHELYLRTLAENRIPDSGKVFLKSRSTVSKADRIDAPALVIQGWPDTLFTPNEGHRIVEALRDNGVESKLVLFDGGHTATQDTAPDDQVAEIESMALAWFDQHLRGESAALADVTYWDTERETFREADGFPPTDASVAELSLATFETDDGGAGLSRAVEGLLSDVDSDRLVDALDGPISSFDDGLGAIEAALSAVDENRSVVANPVVPTSASQLSPTNADLLPFTVAEFDLVVDEPFELLGTPTLSLSVTPLGARSFCFGKLYHVRDGEAELLDNQAAPTAIEGTPGESQRVEFELVGLHRRFEPGDTLRLALASTDAGFTTARQSVGFVVDREESTISLPRRAVDDDEEDRDENGDDDEEGDGGDEPAVDAEGPGRFSFGGALELVELEIDGGPVFVRDSVPSGWVVEEGSHPYTRTAPPETSERYVVFDGVVKDSSRQYIARAPEGVGETGPYTFGPVEVRTPDGEWEAVEGTERTVLLVGTET